MHDADTAQRHADYQHQRWTDVELLDALRRVHAHYGKISVDTYRRAEEELGGLPALALFMGHRFERFNDAVRAAGLVPNARKRHYDRRSNESLLEDLVRAQVILGRVPSHYGYNNLRRRRPELGLASGPLIRMRFGGWVAALRALEDLTSD